MAMYRYKMNILMIFIIFLSGCEFAEGLQKTKSQPEPAKSRVIVIGIDDTGSYDLWENAKKIVSQIVAELKPGDIIYLRTISDASYIDKNGIFRLEIPQIRSNKPENPFDRRAKRYQKVLAKQLYTIKKEAIERVSQLKSTKATKTDFQGFLAIASEKIALHSKTRIPLVIIASDLQENVHYSPELNLSSTRVIVAGFPPMKDPKKTQEFKKHWKKYFAQIGAINTEFIRVDEKIHIEDF